MSESLGSLLAVNVQTIYYFVMYVLASIGYSQIFKKCGVEMKWAWIPCAREYHLSLCADKEKDGRVYTIVTFFFYFLQIAMDLIPANSRLILLSFIPLAGVYVTMIIYMIKIFVLK